MLATAEGERRRLTFYREEKKGGGIEKEGKEKEKTRGYTIEQKEKRRQNFFFPFF